MAKILIVEDDRTFSKILNRYLEGNGFSCTCVYNAGDALSKIQSETFDLILTDYKLPDGNGIEILKWIRQNRPGQKSMIMTRYSDVNTIISSMKLGALDFLIKPINPDKLLVSINEVLKSNYEEAEDKEPVRTIQLKGSSDYVKGSSSASQKLYKEVALVAPTDMSVIIYGESGTGKEHIARLIHESSSRNGGPFVAVDCGAIPSELAQSELFGHVKGAFTGALTDKTGQLEVASGGTIFLDELGNLSYDIQVQLLRALQEKHIKKVGDTKDIKIDVRIIVATNEDLKSSMQKGEFREDLYHRLNEFTITLPALRERKSDISQFVYHFIDKANKQLGRNVKTVDDEAMEVLKNYSWPGNIRELMNMVKRSVLLADGEVITKEAFPAELVANAQKGEMPEMENKDSLKLLISENEKELIIKTLIETKYNKSKTAKILQIDRKTLYAKIEKYGIDA